MLERDTKMLKKKKIVGALEVESLGRKRLYPFCIFSNILLQACLKFIMKIPLKGEGTNTQE